MPGCDIGLGCEERPGVDETLNLIALQRDEAFDIGCRLCALGDDLDAERMGKVDDGAGMRLVVMRNRWVIKRGLSERTHARPTNAFVAYLRQSTQSNAPIILDSRQ